MSMQTQFKFSEYSNNRNIVIVTHSKPCSYSHGVNTWKYPAFPSRFENGYCSRIGERLGGWVQLCTCLMGNVLLISLFSYVGVLALWVMYC